MLGRPGYPSEVRRQFWEQVRAGDSVLPKKPDLGGNVRQLRDTSNHDLLVKHQTSMFIGAQDENRTHDLRITSALLYP